MWGAHADDDIRWPQIPGPQVPAGNEKTGTKGRSKRMARVIATNLLEPEPF